AIALFGTPIYAFHEIVHNRPVVERFRAKGVVFVESIDEVPECGTVLYSAHGVAPEIRRASARRRLRAIDATCPLVTKVHMEAVLVLVLGSRNSSNSQRLAEISQQHGRTAYLIDGVQELRDEWFAGVQTVLVTAGASAPEDVVEATVNYLRDRFGATVESRTV